MNKKIVALVLACVLIFSCVVGGTLALLMDKTAKVTNTFTFGNVDITLEESDPDGNYKLVPGQTTEKDPVVTVTADSEDAYVFIKVEESANLDYFVTYSIITGVGGWTALPGEEGVYYREYTTANTDTDYPVLTGNLVTCNAGVTKDRVDAVTNATEEAPTLAFTAYAVQKEGVANVADAWTVANA